MGAVCDRPWFGIHVFPVSPSRYAEAGAFGIRDAAPHTCGWIIDLRGNGGGNMGPMLTALEPLLPNGKAMSFRLPGGGDSPVTIQDDGGGIGGKTQVSVPGVPKVTGQPIAVLYDERTASSGEVAAAVFLGLDDVESFGTPTAGYTSANSPIPMADEAVLVITSMIYADRNGRSLEEMPIQPDHATSAADAPAAATEWLQSLGCR